MTDIKNIQAELSRVFFADDESLSITQDSVDRIVLATDGNGVFGRYDRIHVFGETRTIWIAHNVEGFELLLDEPE